MIPYQHFTGRLTADPELRQTNNGTPVANFRLAQNDATWDEQTRDWKTTTQLFLTVTCWEQLAEQAAATLTKGDQVLVHGKLRTREWQDRDGNNRNTTEIAAKTIKLLHNLPKPDQQQHTNDPWNNTPTPTHNTDDAPF